jgi:polyhydroxybutyrate depolymerase
VKHRNSLFIALTVSFIVLAAACGRAPYAVGNTATPPPECGSGGPLTGPGGNLDGPYLQRTLVTSSGDERKFLLRLPAEYQEGVPSDVVFNFHGATSNALDQLQYGDFRSQADRDGVILVMPDANKLYPDPEHELAGYWNSAWEANLRVRDADVDFVLEVVELLKSEYCTSTFYAAGMSAGGDMVSALRCLPDSPFASYAPVTYLYYKPDECSAAPPRPLIYFHGSDDRVVPITGSDAPWFDPPVREKMQSVATHNGCGGRALEGPVSDEVIRYSWSGCAAPTEWYLIEGGGHTWPGGPERPKLGHTTGDISASDLIWEFFFGTAEQ